MNTRLLRKVAKHISEEPKRFVMGYYCGWGSPGAVVRDDDYEGQYPDCGTAACIAGWTAILSNYTKDQLKSMMDFEPRQVGAKAQELLGISAQQRDQLFYTENWPRKFLNRFLKAKTAKARANCGVARIEHFIATRGKE